jgi:folylpolyglutamate synthase/dihydropteroate synthase
VAENLPIRAEQNLTDALSAATAACSEKEAVLICGSLYLAEQVEKLL